MIKSRPNDFAALCIACLLSAPASAQLMADASDPLTQLSRMSLEELAHVEVTSVSKTAQSLSSAPASIYVITHEDIQRSGVLSIPEERHRSRCRQVLKWSMRRV